MCTLSKEHNKLKTDFNNASLPHETLFFENNLLLEAWPLKEAD